MVVRRVTQIENIVIATGKIVSISQLPPDSPIIAIRPTRAECAVAVINNNIGVAHKNPMAEAVRLILPTMICI